MSLLVESLKKISVTKLLESADMLDVSIKNADKVATNDKKRKAFLESHWIVSEKFDGTKATVWRNGEDFDPSDYSKNWVISYKNQVMYPEEFHHISSERTKTHSVGITQYAFIHDHFKVMHKKLKSIPKNTELFLEFIQNKNTLTRDYSNKHGLFLISFSPATAEIDGGILRTKPTHFVTDSEKLEKMSGLLSIPLPPVLFEGSFSSKEELLKGAKNPKLKDLLSKVDYDENDLTKTYEQIKNAFLILESSLGGTSEGVVLKNKDDESLLKFVQADQYDKNLRMSRREKWVSDPEIDTKYWNGIFELSEKLIKDLPMKLEGFNLSSIMKELSQAIHTISERKLGEMFSEKLEDQIKKGMTEDQFIQKIYDDLHENAKRILMNKLPEHNNALMIGRFQPLTKAHFDIVVKASKEFNKVVVCVVDSKKDDSETNPLSGEFRLEVLEEAFKQYPNVIFITSSTGTISTIISKAKIKIKYLLAGTDRVAGYQDQTKYVQDLQIMEIPRTDEDISATKVRNAVKNDDFETFKRMTPSGIWKFFDKFKELIK